MDRIYLGSGTDQWNVIGAATGLLLFLPGLIWLLLGLYLTLRESPVDKPNRVAQFYGYTVCLIALILVLTSVSSLLDNAFERANPLQGRARYDV